MPVGGRWSRGERGGGRLDIRLVDHEVKATPCNRLGNPGSKRWNSANGDVANVAGKELLLHFVFVMGLKMSINAKRNIIKYTSTIMINQWHDYICSQ